MGELKIKSWGVRLEEKPERRRDGEGERERGVCVCVCVCNQFEFGMMCKSIKDISKVWQRYREREKMSRVYKKIKVDGGCKGCERVDWEIKEWRFKYLGEGGP